jgi:hypothetical protein
MASAVPPKAIFLKFLIVDMFVLPFGPLALPF